MRHEPKSIEWGWDQPTYQRSEEHRKFIIDQYNRNRPVEEHITTIEEYNNILRKEKENK
tara:strand:- start:55 stop:231 length:177 start_codon:yes stop_codon:yes gene_type:complete